MSFLAGLLIGVVVGVVGMAFYFAPRIEALAAAFERLKADMEKGHAMV